MAIYLIDERARSSRRRLDEAEREQQARGAPAAFAAAVGAFLVIKGIGPLAQAGLRDRPAWRACRHGLRSSDAASLR